jgi:hypothetical protein
MELLVQEQRMRFLEALKQFKEAMPISKDARRRKLISQVDLLTNDEEGLQVVYDCIPELVESGFFEGSVWERPKGLVPALVRGTLLSGYPNNIYELLSELRFIAIYEQKLVHPQLSVEWVEGFLKDVIVHNFDIAYFEIKQPNEDRYDSSELKKIRLLFDFMVEKIPVQALKTNLLKELETAIAHRPIATAHQEAIIESLHVQFELDRNDKLDQRLQYFCEVMYRYAPEQLKSLLPDWGRRKVKAECELAGENMKATGLIAPYHMHLLKHVAQHFPEFIPESLALNSHGVAEFERHKDLVVNIILDFIVLDNKQAVYGLSRVLERNLFSKKSTLHALHRLMSVRIHPMVARHLNYGQDTEEPATARQLLVGGTLSLLGQPLGVRQGNNPTCQSARALSMWSRHAPAKLINLIIDAASSNNMIFRYGNRLIESNSQGLEVGESFDFNLDYVSIVLVPHLDKIYAEMMRLASLHHPGEDPHVSVNPAFYGHWIQTGFMSVYNQLMGRIEQYEKFIATFYASFHPEFNGGQPMVYPVPLGIFITDSSAYMRGFHAISLTRVRKAEDGEWRAYFFNPNSEGPQNWGQEIRPSVSGNGELHGESSLPFYQLMSRVYAFHFNRLRLGDKIDKIPSATIRRVKRIALDSWGKQYQWAPSNT